MSGDLSSIDGWARKMSTLKDAEKAAADASPPTPRSFLRRLFARLSQRRS